MSIINRLLNFLTVNKLGYALHRPYVFLDIIVFTPNTEVISEETDYLTIHAPGAIVRNNRIEKDIKIAEKIWGITLRYSVTEIPNPIIDFPYEGVNAQNIFKFGDLGPRGESLLNQYTRSGIITVFYIPLENEYLGALADVTVNKLDGKLKGAIFLTDKASYSLAFAHELGHALFARIENGVIRYTNPGSEHLPEDARLHSDKKENLMNPRATSETLDTAQRKKALSSPFIRTWWSDFLRRLRQIRYPIQKPRPPGSPEV
ncbi:hypothetical protein FC695_03505 [Bacillus cereus]|uniref:Uncharacterized protein n=1 Tax=Bacillus cereus TaxID=1396 RepID=A0A9X8ZRT1_BACCE|nr:hypothetical protein [Bacillus cereus]TKH25456.1 hypothetical protein FC692_19520 [Bacillus cereus]TKJ07511.1 hypothetical protein FC695_03505 [Bacillus cereus]